MVRVSRNLRDAAKLLACAAIAACSSDSGSKADVGVKRDNLIVFPHFYSAYDDGSHDYEFTPSVPLADPNADVASDPLVASSLKWTVDAKTLVDMGEFADLPGGRLIKTKAAGSAVIKVEGTTKSGVKVWGDAPVTISQATADEWAKGDARYNNGKMVDFTMLGGMRSTDGMGLCGLPVSTMQTIPKDSACSNCHNSSAGAFSVEHTPTQTAGYSDGDLIQIFTMAQKPAGGTFNSPLLKPLAMMSPETADCIYKAFHTWDIDEDTRDGIVWKLRSIAPKKQAAIDIGRLIMMARAQMAAGGAAGAAAP